MKRLFFISLLVIPINFLFGQEDFSIPTNEEDYQKQYERNIRKSRINGVYIPANLEEAMEELIKLSPPEALEKFKNAQEDVIAHKLHFGLGRWIYVFWNFEGGSRYVEFLRQQGLAYHDHMIQFTIVSLHRKLNGSPLEIQERVKMYQEKVRQDLLEKVKRGSTVIEKDSIE